MALIVEDGTVVAGAESYISVADADTWHDDRGNTAWAALSTAAKEAALRKATDYMLQVYGRRWAGDRVDADQGLDWPRSGVEAHGFDVASDAVPAAVARACAELALRASTADLTPDVTRVTLRETVGPISVEYDPNGSPLPDYQSIDNMLAPYLSGSTSSVFRVVTRA